MTHTRIYKSRQQVRVSDINSVDRYHLAISTDHSIRCLNPKPDKKPVLFSLMLPFCGAGVVVEPAALTKRARAATCCHRNRCMGMPSHGHHSSLHPQSDALGFYFKTCGKFVGRTWGHTWGQRVAAVTESCRSSVLTQWRCRPLN
jgi:hypothetical protein